MTAKDIMALLEAKHAEDVFIPECKDGPSQASRHVRMDAWAMNKSWANPLITAYEIKVSRQDFIKDNKWPAYLDCCNQLYFVCPRGLIGVHEMSPQLGLIYISKTASILVTKKKAPYREVTIPETLWRYILMCRVKTKAEDDDLDKATIWKQWLAKKTEWGTIGWLVSKGWSKN